MLVLSYSSYDEVEKIRKEREVVIFPHPSKWLSKLKLFQTGCTESS